MRNTLFSTLFLTLNLLTFNAFAAPSSPAEVLNKVREGLKSLSANFHQYEIFNNGEHGEQTSGTMWLNAPNQFRWAYTEPVPQLIVANGDKVWVYDEDLEQVTIKAQDSDKNPMYVLLDKDLTEKNYKLELEHSFEDEFEHELKNETNSQYSSSEFHSQTIKLTPLVESDEIKTVWLTVLNNNIIEIKVENHMQNTVRFEFSEIQRNPSLDAGFFEFIPPADVDVIDDFQIDIPTEISETSEISDNWCSL